MVNILHGNAIPFDRPAIYQINVQGRIDPEWSDRMAGMKIYKSSEQPDLPITTLDGELSDQAALLGVLNSLYELHLPIISVLIKPYPHGKEKSDTRILRPRIGQRRAFKKKLHFRCKNGSNELVFHQFSVRIATINPHWRYFGICHQTHAFTHWVKEMTATPDSLLKS